MALHTSKRTVRLQEVDAAGIIFFTRFLEYCHDAYFELLDGPGMDLPAAIASGPYMLPLVHTEADFISPLRFGDKVIVSVDDAVGNKSSYTVHYTVTKGEDGTVCCKAKTVHAAISRSTFKPLKELPKELREALQM